MTMLYLTATATARLQAVIDALGTTAVLVIGTSALSGATGVLVSFSLNNPAGVAALRALTFSGTPKTGVAAAGGVAAKAELRTGAGAVVASGLTVGSSGSGCNVIIDSTAIVNGRTVYLLSAVITHP